MQATPTALDVAASAPALTKARVQVQLDGGKWFEAQYPEEFEKYRLSPVSSDKMDQAWGSSPKQFLQNQLNWLWCFFGRPSDRRRPYAHIFISLPRILPDKADTGEVTYPAASGQGVGPLNNPYNPYPGPNHDLGRV